MGRNQPTAEKGGTEVALTITDEQIQALADAIAAGELRVTMPDGASVQYADSEDLIRRYNFLVARRRSEKSGDFRISRARFLR